MFSAAKAEEENARNAEKKVKGRVQRRPDGLVFARNGSIRFSQFIFSRGEELKRWLLRHEYEMYRYLTTAVS